MKTWLLPALALLISLRAYVAAAEATDSFPVTIHVHADQPLGELKPAWRFFGADEPNYATMKNGEKLLG